MKRILPKSLLGRTVLIIVTPLVLLQLVSATVFYESHWTKVSLGLARGLSGDVAALIELLRQDPSPEGVIAIRQLAARTMGLSVKLEKGKILARVSVSTKKIRRPRVFHISGSVFLGPVSGSTLSGA